MTKKAVVLDKGYLEKKIAELQNNRNKVLELLETYNVVLKKLEGAIEVTASMLDDFKKVQDDDTSDKV